MIAYPPGGLRAERAPKDPIWRSACSHTFSWGRVNGPPYMTVRSGACLNRSSLETRSFRSEGGWGRPDPITIRDGEPGWGWDDFSHLENSGSQADFGLNPQNRPIPRRIRGRWVRSGACRNSPSPKIARPVLRVCGVWLDSEAASGSSSDIRPRSNSSRFDPDRRDRPTHRPSPTRPSRADRASPNARSPV